MSIFRVSPAMAVALVALFVALGGSSFSASRGTSHGANMSVARQGVAGGRLAARAYAVVTPLCDTCKPPLHFTPLDGARSRNVTLGSARSGAPRGTWCFGLRGGISASSPTVVASAEGARTTAFLQSSPTSFSVAEWVAEGAGCPPNQVEIQTIRYTAGPAGLIAKHERDIAFSFTVD